MPAEQVVWSILMISSFFRPYTLVLFWCLQEYFLYTDVLNRDSTNSFSTNYFRETNFLPIKMTIDKLKSRRDFHLASLRKLRITEVSWKQKKGKRRRAAIFHFGRIYALKEVKVKNILYLERWRHGVVKKKIWFVTRLDLHYLYLVIPKMPQDT